MKEKYGRKYVRHEDIDGFQVPFRQGVMFLEEVML